MKRRSFIQPKYAADPFEVFNLVKMKPLLLMLLVALAPSLAGQTVFTVDYASQADVKVFVVEYESQADLKVFKVPYASQAKGNEGKWFWVPYASQAHKKVVFVDYASQAELKIFFVKYESHAGWRNSAKKHLVY